MNTLLYIEEFSQLMRAFYTKQLSTDHIDPIADAEINGYIKAGLVAKLATAREIQDEIDKIHFEVFQKTREERRADRALDGTDKAWNVFDEPTYRRKR